MEIAIAKYQHDLQKGFPRADPAAHLANAINSSDHQMNLYLRYNNQLHRQYLRCLKELRDLQALRQAEPIEPNDPEPPPENDPPIEPKPNQSAPHHHVPEPLPLTQPPSHDAASPHPEPTEP